MSMPQIATLFVLLATPNLSWAYQNPLDILESAFKIEKPGPLAEGAKNVVFLCHLAQGDVLNSCRISNPSGTTFNATTAPDGTGVITSDDKCGLLIEEMSEADFGQWSCIVEIKDKIKHIGTVNLLKLVPGWLADIHLPDHITAENYRIMLSPLIEDGANFTTLGSMDLEFHTSPSTVGSKWANKIVLHSKQIIIDAISIKDTSMSVTAHEYDVDREFLIIHLSKDLSPSSVYNLHLEFTSILNDDLSGFYRSSYVEPDTDHTKWLAVTQFETTGARKSFPCLDEPSQKANFTISLRRPKQMVARSNMNVVQVGEPVDHYIPGYVEDTFNTSVKMSTYLVAFLVADFNYTANENDDTYKIWHEKSKGEEAKYAAKMGPLILEFYEEFFKIPFPLPKMDMAAIPDFGPGAMENWGLITYREVLLLTGPHSSSNDKERSVIVMAHELAHQWFGNIVTMEWWTDLWLNEGFATYVEYHGTTHVLPETDLMNRIVVNDLHKVFLMDALETSQSITLNVTNPSYDAHFGAIAYSKGACLLRMIEHILTLDTFKKGITKYLTDHEYGNAATSQLWDALTEAANDDGRLPDGVTMANIMDSWTSQAGYPVLTVVPNQEQIITQRQFFFADTATSDFLWRVPINVAYPTNTSNPGFNQTLPTSWLNTANMTFKPDTRPYVINVQETGYYRVNYDEKNWQDLINLLLTANDHTKIHTLNRAQLIDDSLNLARANQLNYNVALELTQYLSKERDFIPWQAAFRSFTFLNDMFEQNTGDHELLKEYLIDILLPLYTELGFGPQEHDTHINILSRQSATEWMCMLGHQHCVDNAKQLFKQWVDSGSNPSQPDQQKVVYNTAIKTGSTADWQFMLEQFLKATVDSERQKYLYALAKSSNSTVLKNYLDMTISESSGIRRQDVTYVYRSVGGNVVGRDLSFAWLQENWYQIEAYLGSRFAKAAVANIVDSFAATANTVADIDKIDMFLNEFGSRVPSQLAAIRQALETARANKKWMDQSYQSINQWLHDRDDNPSNTAAHVTFSTAILFYSVAAVVYLYLC